MYSACKALNVKQGAPKSVYSACKALNVKQGAPKSRQPFTSADGVVSKKT